MVGGMMEDDHKDTVEWAKAVYSRASTTTGRYTDPDIAPLTALALLAVAAEIRAWRTAIEARS